MDIVKQNKIRILRETADRIEGNPNAFYWGKLSTCTCGILASVALNQDTDLVTDTLVDSGFAGDSWSNLYRCHQTGLKMSVVFQELERLGFTINDIVRAEYGDLATEEIYEEREELQFWDFEQPEWVVSNLRQWADELERQLLTVQSKQPQPQSVPVAVTE